MRRRESVCARARERWTRKRDEQIDSLECRHTDNEADEQAETQKKFKEADRQTYCQRGNLTTMHNRQTNKQTYVYASTASVIDRKASQEAISRSSEHESKQPRKT